MSESHETARQILSDNTEQASAFSICDFELDNVVWSYSMMLIFD